MEALLPTTPQAGPNLVILTVNSDKQSVEVTKLRSMLARSRGNALVLLVDAGQDPFLAAEVRRYSAKYVSNASLSSQALLSQMRIAALDE
jgi:hypothetical protein